MYGRIINLEIPHGVHPVGVGENYRYIFDNIVIRVTVPEATSVCQYDHLCVGLKAEIDGVFHRVQAIFDTKLTK